MLPHFLKPITEYHTFLVAGNNFSDYGKKKRRKNSLDKNALNVVFWKVLNQLIITKKCWHTQNREKRTSVHNTWDNFPWKKGWRRSFWKYFQWLKAKQPKQTLKQENYRKSPKQSKEQFTSPDSLSSSLFLFFIYLFFFQEASWALMKSYKGKRDFSSSKSSIEPFPQSLKKEKEYNQMQHHETVYNLHCLIVVWWQAN